MIVYVVTTNYLHISTKNQIHLGIPMHWRFKMKYDEKSPSTYTVSANAN